MSQIPPAGPGAPAYPYGSAAAGAAPNDAQRQVIESPSYGAAFFNWIYLLAMRAWGHAALAFVFTLLVPPTFWIVWIVYGMYGKRIAWQTRRWRDFDDFLACQRAWTRAAVVWTIVIVAIMLFGIILSILVPFFAPRHQFRPSI
ncbi:MAG TPA: hypothetical protein VGX97_10950 [bacterium]|nr:hypothetical protein [bacterium]